MNFNYLRVFRLFLKKKKIIKEPTAEWLHKSTTLWAMKDIIVWGHQDTIKVPNSIWFSKIWILSLFGDIYSFLKCPRKHPLCLWISKMYMWATLRIISSEQYTYTCSRIIYFSHTTNFFSGPSFYFHKLHTKQSVNKSLHI